MIMSGCDNNMRGVIAISQDIANPQTEAQRICITLYMAGMTQKSIAIAVHASQPGIQNILTGRRSGKTLLPELRMLFKLSGLDM